MLLGDISKKEFDCRVNLLKGLVRGKHALHWRRKESGGKMGFSTPGKLLVVLLLVLSLAFHLVLVEGIHLLSQSKETKKQESTRFAFKIKPPEEYPVSQKAVVAKPASETKDKNRPVKVAKTKAPKLNNLSPQKLVALGQKHLGMVQKGEFPPLILSYSNPFPYVREMYGLGCKTVVYEMTSRQYYEIDLFSGDILPFSSNDFEGFSSFKRVIKDSVWTAQKIRAAARLKASPDSLEILLLVPISVEMRWIGHQVHLFRQMNIPIPDVETVEARFQEAKLKLVRVHLKDGSSRIVSDHGGA